MPVLAEQAVKRACLKENGKVLVSIFRSSRIRIFRISGSASSGTYPVGNAVCRKGVMIPGEFALLRRYTGEFPVYICPEAAIAYSPFRNPAFIYA